MGVKPTNLGSIWRPAREIEVSTEPQSWLVSPFDMRNYGELSVYVKPKLEFSTASLGGDYLLRKRVVEPIRDALDLVQPGFLVSLN